MSTEYSNTILVFNHPRSIFTTGFQLFYSLVAMIPVYLYVREIIKLEVDALYVLLFLPLAVGFLLFTLMIQMNQFYWREEREYKRRDIFMLGLKSTSFIIFYFYFFFLLVFGYWFSDSEVYFDMLHLENPIGKLVTEASISVALVMLIVQLRRGIQKQKYK
ncbi:MAG: hypothetical protein INQ03_19845 [Candidatus Heimdallarchaeota archaeon]|nr:hypothetical protein [Candidatus Heimdallarchaeota archaeon]